MKANFKSIIMLLVLVLAVVFAVSAFSGRAGSKDAFTYSELKELLENDFVTSFEVDANSYVKITAYKPITDKDGNFVYKEGTKELQIERDDKGEPKTSRYE